MSRSLIKHVFLIIKENRTYDQMLGDVAWGNGAKELAVFAPAVPNQHALVKRFPLMDNVYAPSRQSADGHPWIGMSGSFYSNDILSPDWIRSYPRRPGRRRTHQYSKGLPLDRSGCFRNDGKALWRMEQRHHHRTQAGWLCLHMEWTFTGPRFARKAKRRCRTASFRTTRSMFLRRFRQQRRSWTLTSRRSTSIFQINTAQTIGSKSSNGWMQRTRCQT